MNWRNDSGQSVERLRQGISATGREDFYILRQAVPLIYERRSLLISLAIFQSLATECRRDIALLSPSLMASIDVTLSALPTDLEIVARAASVVCSLQHAVLQFLIACRQFTAWTTYTDGHLIGTDSNLTRDYLLVLNQFASLGSSSAADQEVKNRLEYNSSLTLLKLSQYAPSTRLIGFAALTGALNSEALYNDAAQFRAQVSRIMRPILVTLFQAELAMLDEQ